MTKMNVATLETLALLVIFVGNVPGERFEIFCWSSEGLGREGRSF